VLVKMRHLVLVTLHNGKVVKEAATGGSVSAVCGSSTLCLGIAQDMS
jgi:hypothetical protein